MKADSDRFGQKRQFYFAEELTVDLFSRLVVLLKDAANGANYASGWFSLARNDREIERTVLDEWAESVRRHWSEIAVALAQIDRGDVLLWLTCDIRRQILELEFRGAQEQEVHALFVHWTEQLKLRAAPPDPYRYRSSSAAYQVRRWDQSEFIEALEIAMTHVGRGTMPAVRNVYFNETLPDFREHVRGFRTVEEFFEFVKSSQIPFESVGFSVEGALGVGLGVTLNAEHTKLEFRSTVMPEELEKLVFPFKGGMKLKAIKLTDGGSGLSEAVQPTKQEPWWVKHAITLAVALIALVSVRGIVELVRAIFPTYEVKITAPTKQDSLTVVGRKAIELRWIVKPVDFSFRSIRTDAPATVRTIKNGVIVAERTGLLSGTTIPVDTGRYEIEVAPNLTSEPKSIVVFSKAPPTP